jgi:hypothetical protein
MLDLRGQQFDRLTVRERGPNKGQRTQWYCDCICGISCLVPTSHLRSGGKRSCGCLRAERAKEVPTTHGMTRTPTYRSWLMMRARCTNPNFPKYPDYGGRGISIEWQSFEEFFADMGPRPSLKHTIERVDNDGNYCKGNCIWGTPEQQANNKRNNTYVMHEGQRYTVPQLARYLGINRVTLWSRLRKQGLI